MANDQAAYVFFVGTSIRREGASTRPNKIVTVENGKGDQITDDTSTIDVILYALIAAGAFVVRLHPEGMLFFGICFIFNCYSNIEAGSINIVSPTIDIENLIAMSAYDRS